MLVIWDTQYTSWTDHGWVNVQCPWDNIQPPHELNNSPWSYRTEISIRINTIQGWVVHHSMFLNDGWLLGKCSRKRREKILNLPVGKSEMWTLCFISDGGIRWGYVRWKAKKKQYSVLFDFYPSSQQMMWGWAPPESMSEMHFLHCFVDVSSSCWRGADVIYLQRRAQNPSRLCLTRYYFSLCTTVC